MKDFVFKTFDFAPNTRFPLKNNSVQKNTHMIAVVLQQ